MKVELKKYEDGSYSFFIIGDDGRKWGRYHRYGKKYDIREMPQDEYSARYSHIEPWEVKGPIRLRVALIKAKRVVNKEYKKEEAARKARNVVKSGVVEL